MRAARIKCWTGGLCVAAVLGAGADGAGDDYGRPYLDAPVYEYWGASGGYVLPAQTTIPDWDDLGIWELEAWGYLLYQEFDWGGDLDLQAKLDMNVLHGFDGVSSGYPLTMATLQARYAQRYVGGWGLQVLFEPGLYSALDQLGTKDLGFPFSGIITKGFNEEFALQFGLKILPGFDQTVDPIAGFRWTRGQIDMGPELTVDIGYPETRVLMRAYRELYFDAGLNFSLWPEYQMDEDDPRDRIAYDETRAHVGVGWAVSEDTMLDLQVGYVFNRELSFEGEGPDIDIDDALFLRVGVSGRL